MSRTLLIEQALSEVCSFILRSRTYVEFCWSEELSPKEDVQQFRLDLVSIRRLNYTGLKMPHHVYIKRLLERLSRDIYTLC